MMHWLVLPLMVLASGIDGSPKTEPNTSAGSPLITSLCEARPAAAGHEWRCAGLPGVDVYMWEEDGRFRLSLGTRNPQAETFAVPHTIGRTMDWRIAGNRAESGIVRYRFPAEEGGKAQELLVIVKVGGRLGDGCVVAVVDVAANSAAPELARQTADLRSPVFRCGVDRPEAAGRASDRTLQRILPSLG